MKRNGSVLVALVCLLVAGTFVGAESSHAAPAWAPTLTLPDDSTLTLCDVDSVCFEVSGTDPDWHDKLTLTLISGPLIDIPVDSLARTFSTTRCFYPETAGDYDFVFELRDKQGHIVVDSFTYTIEFNRLPTIEDQSFSGEVCPSGSPRDLPLIASDPDNDLLVFELLSGPGTIDPETGVITYTPGSDGTTEWEVAVYDACGGDSALITDDVTVNQPPYLSNADTTITLCSFDEICILLTGVDPEGGPVAIAQTSGPGSTTPLTDNTAETCFLPDDVDSATYELIYCLTDQCTDAPGRAAAAVPVCEVDTVLVTVLRKSAVSLACPPEVQFGSCETGPYCYAVTVDGEGDYTLTVVSGDATIDGDSVCVDVAEPGEYLVEIEIQDECNNVDTCATMVIVSPNQAPVVNMPDDMSPYLCAPGQFCLYPVYVDDADQNIESIDVSYGEYRPSTQQVCFDVDTAGTYEIWVRATDVCGEVDSASTTVTVTLNEPPIVSIGDDIERVLCAPEEICVDVSVDDGNLSKVLPRGIDGAYYNSETGQVCFTPEVSLTDTLIVYVEDDCDLWDEDTILVNVDVNQAPEITGLPDTTLYLCEPAEVCLDYSVFDADDNVESMSVNLGQIRDGQVCFVPYNQGDYEITLTVTDSCGLTDEKTAVVSVKTDQQMVIECPPDTSIFLCEPELLCFPINVDHLPDGAEIRATGTNAYWDDESGSVCFYSDCCIENTIGIEVVTDCGTYSCSFNVTVETNTAPLVILPPDTSLFLCESGEVCLPVGIRDDEGGPIDITITGVDGATYDDFLGRVCFDAPGAGEYTLTVTATDSCGKTDSDQVTVSVTVNTPPVIANVSPPMEVLVCDTGEVCVDLGPGLVVDADNNIDSVYAIGAELNLETNELCFSADTSEEYCFPLVAVDSCGAEYRTEWCFIVTRDLPPAISCPADIPPMELCETGLVCLPVSVGVTPGNATVTVLPNGTYDELTGEVCIEVSEAGTIPVTIIAETTCGVDSCVFTVDVTLIDAPQVMCESEGETAFFCEAPGVFKIPVSILGTDPVVTILPETAVIENDSLIVEVSESGFYTAIVRAENSCGVDSCVIDIEAAFNQPPEFSFGNDTTITVCDLGTDSICIPYELSDPDGNISSVTASMGVLGNGRVCFLPQAAGDVTITVTARDECNEQVSDQVVVTIREGEAAVIDCPQNTIFVSTDLPDSVAVYLPIEPEGAVVTVLPSGIYDPETDSLYVYIEEPGSHNFTVSAEAECGSDECQITIESSEYFPPQVSCRGSVDTILCLLEPTQVCLPVSVTPVGVDVTVSPIGEYADGEVCFTVDTAGTYEIEISATDGQTTASCTSVVVAVANVPPVVTLPQDSSVVFCGPSEVCVPVDIVDSDDENLNVTAQINPLVRPSSGRRLNDRFEIPIDEFCSLIETPGEYEIVVTATDGCDQFASDTMYLSVAFVSPEISLGADSAVTLCEPEEICLPFDFSTQFVTSITSNLGSVDTENNEVCFTPTEPGEYEVIVELLDECDQMVADTSYVNVSFNTAPEITSFPDTSIYLCSPREVCIDFDYADADDNVVEVTASRGEVRDGAVCFAPYSQGQYEITLTITDACGLTDQKTAVVTVQTDQQIVMDCPSDTSIFLCEPELLCFPITVDNLPDGAEIRALGTNAYWDSETGSVCFYSDCCIENTIGIEVVTECGSYSCAFTVTVETNVRPLVILPKDSTIVMCDISIPFSVPVGISDRDHNIASIEVTIDRGSVSYDPTSGQAEITPDGAGQYWLRAVAIDSCGIPEVIPNSIGVDSMLITLEANSGPTITYDTEGLTRTLCDSTEEVCIDVVVEDSDGNIESIEAFGAVYDEASGTLCLNPNLFGDTCISLVAVDACGEKDSVEICLSIQRGSSVDILCPEEPFEPVELCDAGTVCIPLPIDIAGRPETVTIEPGYGTWANDSLCFLADTSGVYTIDVSASGECNDDECAIEVSVDILPDVTIACPDDEDIFLCDTTTLCRAFTVSSSVTSVSVSEPAYLSGDSVCIPITGTGDYTITLTAEGSCGSMPCEFTISAVVNRAPVVDAGRDTSLVVCELNEICLPIEVSDSDGNLDVVSSSAGEIANDSLCFMPDDFGETVIVVTATDECGLMSQDSVVVSVLIGDSAQILCPDGNQFVSVCGPEQVCLTVPISPPDAEVTVLPNGFYDPEISSICLDVTEGGPMDITVIAGAECSVDTCEFTLQVDMGQPPVISCPDDLDTLLCLDEPVQLCFPVDIAGTGVQVNINPEGSYSAGFVCIPVEAAGEYPVDIIAFGACGTDSCRVNVTVDADELPVLTLPTEGLTFELCPDELEEQLCIPGVFAEDVEADLELADLSISQVCGPGELDLTRADSGQICFIPQAFGQFEFCIQADDGCHIVTDTLVVDVNLRPDCDVCLRVFIDGGECTPVNQRKNVKLTIETNEPIGGFDLLVNYDPTALLFENARITGTAIEDWEYFQVRLDDPSCGGNCSGRFVRLVGIADNNTTGHPPASAFNPNGDFINLQFFVTNNQNFGGQSVPLKFNWYDCADNAFSNPAGDLLYLDLRIYDAEHNLKVDEDVFDDAQRIWGEFGAFDSCIIQDAKTLPLRCVEFYNGEVCIIDPDSIDARGDINLNGVAYEISDAVLFSRYFVEGLGVFNINVAGQVAATDVNADGLTLTIADLTYLIRVIVGDASPTPKLNPYPNPAIVSLYNQGDGVRLSTDAGAEIGAAYFVYDIDAGVSVGAPTLRPAASSMDMAYQIEQGKLKVLLYDIGTASVAAGTNELLDIPLSGNGTIRLARSEIVDYDGRPYRTTTEVNGLPEGYVLEQNYPNPFNPSTQISFALPTAEHWSLRIYNVAGHLVRAFDGDSEGGQVTVEWDGRNEVGDLTASGIYLYRLEAGRFTASKKMILLK